jgi:hypothetical protein
LSSKLVKTFQSTKLVKTFQSFHLASKQYQNIFSAIIVVVVDTGFVVELLVYFKAPNFPPIRDHLYI